MFTSGDTSDGDKFNNKFGYAPPVKVYESAFAQGKVFVCHVQAPPIPPDTAVLHGTADLYELAERVFTVATNNRVIPITDADFLINTVFTFEGLGQIRLSEQEIKFCTTNRELDATVIELTEACVKRLQQFGAKFIRVTTANGGHKYIADREFCIDKGAIQEIKDDEVYYYLGDALGSNGSPILLWDYRAIGMHNQSAPSIEHRALVPILNGNRLLAIAVFQLAVSRSKLTSKDEQWKKRQESLEKRICELEESLEKGNKSNSSQRKTPNAEKEEIATEKKVHNLNPPFTICQVKYKKQSGNGAIYGCEYPEGTFRTLFITSGLEISNVNEITDVYLVFEDKTIGNQYLTPDWVKWLFNLDKFNVTVIEFSPTALKVLSRMKYERLTSDVPVENEDVSVFQYCKESLNFAKGRINKIIGDVIEYSLGTKVSCCGFPLLNEKVKVVGIDVKSNKLEERGLHKAITTRAILEAFKTFITEKLGGRTENELWLEKIAEIPKNEFHLIGIGGFGKVYRIKASNSTETFVAVKLVSGLDNLDEYKSQVDALQKEYRLVTRLGNHPQIIHFFAIVPDNRNYQIMIVMEYMDGGSLADKLQNQQPLPENSVLTYLTQILEGVSFLHRREIYHSDIKPANCLFTPEDKLKISDFGIAVRRSQLQTKSSETSTHFQNDFHYMSPERLQGADRSAANDIWSVGATLVHMISGQPLNHLDTNTQLINNISQYKIFIKGNPLNNYLETLNDSDFKKKLISRTLCNEPSKRANCQQLLRILFPHSKRLPAEALMAAGDKNPVIRRMSYNSERDELFLEDNDNYKYFHYQSIICNIIYKEQACTGAIYKYEYPEQTWRTLFITCNQVLRISNVEDIVGLRLVFKEETIGKLDITPDWVKWLWTSPREQFNVTVIEFSPTALKVLSRMQYTCLISAAPEKKAKVTLYHYNGGDAGGSIIDIVGDCIQYNIKSEISLGSPLLNEARHVVGIHIGLWDRTTESDQTTCKAINIQSILTAFGKYVQEMILVKPDKELSLEKINQIPENEFELIGGGGYGQVYKIKMKAELSVAVKIVQGVGKLSDYETQVRALEKEYAMVTALGNNPRIVQFFAIVRDVSKVRIMIVMEFLEGGSLADRLKDQNPLPNDAVLKYLKQILEGVDFLHQRNIYHSDIKPANILFSKDDDVKICDFGISVGIEWMTESSATASHIKGDLHYMSPERLNNTSRCAANDIWSVGATFVHMISGQPLNHSDTITQLILNISQYKIFISGKPYNEYLQTLNDSDFKKKVISQTLCEEPDRKNSQQLLRILFFHSKRLPSEAPIVAGDNQNTNIVGMNYNSTRDELFLADDYNGVVRAMRVRDNSGDLRDVYKAPYDTSPIIRSVCHMSDSDTLLVCSGEEGPDRKYVEWLVALSRNSSEWREAQRVQTDGVGGISCALSDSRVLIGQFNSTYMELFLVESGPRIARVHRMHVPEEYRWFSATCGSDTLLAMSYGDHSVRLHRLRNDRLEELARIQLKGPSRLMWLADRLLVADNEIEKDSHAVIELEVSDTRLQRRRELIAQSEGIRVDSWCPLHGGFAIFDLKSEALLLYSFNSEMSPIGGNEEY